MPGVVVITSGRAQKADILMRILMKHGVEPVYLPVLKIEQDKAPLEEFVERIKGYDAFIFMTGQSAWGLAEASRAAGLYDALRSALARMEIYCRGQKAAGNVKTHWGLTCLGVYETSDELLAAAGPRLRGRRVAMSFHGIVDAELVEEVKKIAAEVAYIQTYRDEPQGNAERIAEMALRGECDLVVFTSGVAVDAFFQGLGEGARERVVQAMNKQCRAAAVGPVTAEALRRWGVEPAVVPEKPFLAYLGEAIVEYLRGGGRDRNTS